MINMSIKFKIIDLRLNDIHIIVITSTTVVLKIVYIRRYFNNITIK